MEVQKKPKILISTGIYPPAIGGPAEYAKNLENSLRKAGYKTRVKTFNIEHKLPTGIRHLYYFFKILPSVLRADYIIALDTFSVGLPTVLAARLFRKKIVIRTGGDFLWESYVERTGKEVLLKDFYHSSKQFFNLKERLIFKLTGYALRKADAIVWSTLWQKNIFMEPYGLQNQRHFVIENYFAPKEESFAPQEKVFLASTRDLKWKNHARLKSAFEKARASNPEITLDTEQSGHEQFLEKLKNCYAVILVSLGDISPNMILEAIRFNKPFILTKETGLYEKLNDIAIFVDPLDEMDIVKKINFLSKMENYTAQVEKIRQFNFVHTYDEIAGEFLTIYQRLCESSQ